MEYMNEHQLQSEIEAEAMARAIEEEAFMRAFAKTRGQPEPAPAQLDSLGGGESCEGGACDVVDKIMGPINKYSPLRAHPLNVVGEATGLGKHPGLPPPMNFALSGAQEVVNRVSRVFKQRTDPASIRKSAEKETVELQKQVNEQVSRGDKGGDRTKDAPKPKSDSPKPRGVTNKYAPDTFTIGRGDTLWAIGRQYGVSVDDLMAMNPGVDPKRLRIGQTINLRPVAEAAPEAPVDEGPSLLAQKIQAEREKPAPTAFSAFRDVNINNKFNGNLRESRDAAMQYLSSVLMGGASGNSLGRLLRMEAEGKFKQPPRLKRPNW